MSDSCLAIGPTRTRLTRTHLVPRIAGFVLAGLLVSAAARPCLAAPALPDPGLAPSFTTPVAPGMLDLSPGLPGPATTLGATLTHSHGYISSFVGSGGAAGVDGGVTMPLIPGRLTLSAGAGTGQVPVFTAPGFNNKISPMRYNEYHAELDAKLGDNTSLSVGLVGANFHPPAP